MNCVATFTEYDHEFNQGVYNSTAPTIKMLKEINNYLPSSIVNCVVNRYYFYIVIKLGPPPLFFGGGGVLSLKKYINVYLL